MYQKYLCCEKDIERKKDIYFFNGFIMDSIYSYNIHS